MDIQTIELIGFVFYAFVGYKSVMYLRRELLGQRIFIYSDTMAFIFSSLFPGIFFGFLFIPLAIVVWLFKKIF